MKIGATASRSGVHAARTPVLACALVVAMLALPVTAVGQLKSAPPRPLHVAFDGAVKKSRMTWLSKAPLETIRGTTGPVAGNVKFDPRRLSTLRGKLRTPVARMKSGNDIRDKHLHGPRWLDARRWPHIHYTITSAKVRKTKGTKARLSVRGQLTVRGKTVSVPAEVQLRWIAAGPKTQRVPGHWVKVKLKLAVKLADFGITGVGGIVGSKVAPVIAIEGSLYGHTVR